MSRELGISKEEAERAIYADLGIRQRARPVLVGSIGDLEVDRKGIALRARVVSVHNAQRSDGKGTYHFGLLGDSRSDIHFCAWCDFPFSPGDAVLIQNCSVREWNGRMEVVINDGSHISRITDTDDLVPAASDSMPQAIAELSEGMTNLDVLCRTAEVRPSTVEVRGVLRSIVNGVLVDPSGRIEFTCWGPLDLEEGACYRIQGGSVKAYQGRMKLNFDPGSIVRKLSDDELPGLEEMLRPLELRVFQLEEGVMPGGVILRGVFLDVRPGSGLIKRCGECGRRMLKGQCTVHGRVEGGDDLRLRALFDDGTGTIMVKADRSLVEKLLGKDLSEVVEIARDSMTPEMAMEELRETLIGHTWTVTGDPSLDDHGPGLTASKIEPGMDAVRMMEEVSLMAEVMR